MNFLPRLLIPALMIAAPATAIWPGEARAEVTLLDVLHNFGAELLVVVVFAVFAGVFGWLFALRRSVMDRTRALDDATKRLARVQAIGRFADWTLDVKTGASRWSQAFCNLFRISHQVRSMRFNDLVDELVVVEDRTRVRRVVSEAIDGIGPFRFDFQAKCGDGLQRWMHVEGSVTKDPEGFPIRVDAAIQDVTEEREAAQSLELLSTVVEAANDGVLITQPDAAGRYRIIYVNQRYIDITGYSRDELIGKKPGFIQGDGTDPQTVTEVGKAIREGRAFETEILNYRKDGSTFWNGLSVFPIRKDGQVTYYVGLTSDITRRRKSQELLRKAHAEADKASKAKSDFLAAASHDLRQPLQSLSLLLEVLNNRLRAQDDQKVIDMMRTSLSNLGELLGGMLDLSKLDAGMIEPEIRECPLRPILDRVAEDLSIVAEEKGIALAVRPSDAVIFTDGALFERVVRNLVSNAVRYTDRGGILVGCRRRGDNLVLQVWDTGAGIPDDKIEEIFDEYRQLHNPERDRSKGLGLGLAIVRRLSRLLGITISVKSRVGSGSCFEVTAPVAVGARAPRSIVSETCAPGFVGDHHALIIDDDEQVLEATRILFQSWGWRVDGYTDGEEAVESLNVDDAPHLIVADYTLPGGRTGAEVLSAIMRKLGRIVPALIITGDTAPNRVEEIEKSGFTLLYKPINPEDLRVNVHRVLDRQARAQGRAG